MKEHKAIKTGLHHLLFIFLIHLSANAYSQVTRVEFIHAKDIDKYLQIEREWKPIHQQRLENEQIYGRYVLKKHYSGTEDGYNLGIVTIFPSLGAIGYPKTTEPDLKQRMEASREIVKVEIYDTPLFLEIISLPQFLNMEFMKVEEGKDNDYLVLEDEVWKPAHADMKKRGALTTWSVYRQLYPGGYGGEYNYVVVNGFADKKKVTFEPAVGWDEVLKTVHPGIDLAKTYQQTFDTRVLVRTELWEILDKVTPQ